jgi:predicted phosphodiesterase
MKIGIVSDTHSNLYALEEVLNHMNGIGVDLKVHLGDIVGYGPAPNQTLAMTLENFNYIVMGNHDLAVVDPKITEYFNPQAKKAVEWTRNKLSKEETEVLANLSYGHLLNDMLFVHGSPQANNSHGYLLDDSDAIMAFKDPVVDFTIAFVGHTHRPFIWYEESFSGLPRAVDRQVESSVTKQIDEKAIINVGSVGQPRDGDSRASYVIFDTEDYSVTFYKIPYAVEKTVAHMQRLGFDSKAYERLIYGR